MSDRMCPYPGLRPFLEEEAIFFQGREENIATIATVLEQNHFLMLAGSSGDGKSSLVFAGLIPHCRAGFFRADYPSWTVAVFRPERSPMHQLAKALSEALGMEVDPVESSLRHGFSALVDLYLGSAAVGGVEEEAGEKSRLAASQNLLIVADQFEELFTNSENFVGGAPSTEARLCVNLLLETARLALAHSLPIYVVCTMRSDYIGQCNAFPGLPEMIGFSHYFVPRLTRAQLRRVVLEPARLNGDTIAPRLAERLIYDLSEGEDQLPLLQHTLAAIWRRADADSTPMDLPAYYRCGGMSADELPADSRTDDGAPPAAASEDGERYGLEAVLNRHADELFRQATRNEASGRAEWQLARAFTCLTGQDNGRMVRNRMTIGQIARTIETDPDRWPVLEDSLSRMFVPFRSMAAGFVRPLLLEGEPETLPPDTVLDITHEALIRNWDSLRDWTMAEHRRLLTWRELEPQVRRWAQARQGTLQVAEEGASKGFAGPRLSRKGRSYLLPIGPLNYFEDWQEETRPSAYWMARYASPEVPISARMDEGKWLQEQTEGFLSQSARHLALTRFVTRVGAHRIVGGLLAVVLVSALAVGLWRRYQSSNEVVLDKARDRAGQLFFNPLADRTTKKAYLLNAYAEALKGGATPEQAAGAVRGLVARESGDSLRAATALDGAHQFLQFYTAHDHPCVRSLMAYADSVVTGQKEGPQARPWVFLSAVRLHGFWKGMHFLSARAEDSQRAALSLSLVRSGLPAYLERPDLVDRKALTAAVVYDAFYDLSDRERIGRWLDQVEPEKPGEDKGPAARVVSSLFDREELESDVLVKCGKFLCNRLDYYTGIERVYVVSKPLSGTNATREAMFDPIKMFLCQSGAGGPALQAFQQDMLQNFRLSGVSSMELSHEIYPVLLMGGNPIQLAAPGSLPTHAFWGDLFADPGQVLTASLLTSGSYKSFLYNTEVLINNTVGTICTPAESPACELALARFLFEYSAPYSLTLARAKLAEGLRSLPSGMPMAALARALSDSAIAPVYVPAYHAILKAEMPSLRLASKPMFAEPAQPARAVTCLSVPDQRLLDSLTAGLAYNTFARPLALWVSRFANPHTRQPLQEGLRGASDSVRNMLLAHARQSLLVTDSFLMPARTRADSLRQAADMHRIQMLLAHRRADLPRYERTPVQAGHDFSKASLSLVPDLVVNEKDFSATAHKAVRNRQLEDQFIESLRVGMADLYSLSGSYWPAYRELENVYSIRSEAYLLNNILFDALDLRQATRPELAYHYRRYLLGYTSLNNYQ